MILDFLSFLFPSWKLFDETFEIPILYYQVDDSEWIPFLENRSPKSYELFFNPTGILYLLIQSKTHRLLDQMSEDISNIQMMNNPNYLFFKKIIADRLSDYKYRSYRFKLMKQSTNENFLISDEYYA